MKNRTKTFIMMFGIIIGGLLAQFYVEGVYSPLIIGVIVIFSIGFGYYDRKTQEVQSR